MNEMEQYSRRKNFEIHGFPSKPKENLQSFLSDLAQQLDVPNFAATQVSAIHRLPSRDNTTPAILVQMCSVEAKEQWLRSRKNLPRLVQNDFPRLYFNDNLTRVNRELFWLARTKAKEMSFKYVWTRNGKVFARKADGAPLVRINRKLDIERLI